ELTRANLKICQRNNWPDDISRCHRCLAAICRINGSHQEAADHIQKALELARKVGMPELEIEALLESGRLHLDTGRHQEAVQAGRTVLGLCERTGFRLYEPEAELILARAYLGLREISRKDTETQREKDDKSLAPLRLGERIKTFAQSAYEKADQMNYHWPKTEASHLLKCKKNVLTYAVECGILKLYD
ncbi:MAG: tetratricopeptide repeat protein, partial [bacterium]|nr:tetratricopeptide repeat protein [bacterium]